MKRQLRWELLGRCGDHLIHGLANTAHAHQMAQGRLELGRQPQRQPVVAEVEHRIEALLLG